MESKSEPSRKSEQFGGGISRSRSGLARLLGGRTFSQIRRAVKRVPVWETQPAPGSGEGTDLPPLSNEISLTFLFFSVSPIWAASPSSQLWGLDMRPCDGKTFMMACLGGCIRLCSEPFSPGYPTSASHHTSSRMPLPLELCQALNLQERYLDFPSQPCSMRPQFPGNWRFFHGTISCMWTHIIFCSKNHSQCLIPKRKKKCGLNKNTVSKWTDEYLCFGARPK